MAKKKKVPVTVKVEFIRGYGGPEGLFVKGNTETFDKEVADRLISGLHAKVYVAPVVIPPETATPPDDPTAPALKGD